MLQKLEILGKNVREFLEIYPEKPGNVREFFSSNILITLISVVDFFLSYSIFQMNCKHESTKLIFSLSSTPIEAK